MFDLFCQAVLDPIANIEHCTIVHCMARNGYEFGIRVSALGDEWFNAPAPLPEGREKCLCVWFRGRAVCLLTALGAQGRFFGNYTQYDVGGDMGDSAITETAGFGAFIIEGGKRKREKFLVCVCLSSDHLRLRQKQRLRLLAGCRPT